MPVLGAVPKRSVVRVFSLPGRPTESGAADQRIEDADWPLTLSWWPYDGDGRRHLSNTAIVIDDG